MAHARDSGVISKSLQARGQPGAVSMRLQKDLFIPNAAGILCLELTEKRSKKKDRHQDARNCLVFFVFLGFWFGHSLINGPGDLHLLSDGTFCSNDINLRPPPKTQCIDPLPDRAKSRRHYTYLTSCVPLTDAQINRLPLFRQGSIARFKPGPSSPTTPAREPCSAAVFAPRASPPPAAPLPPLPASNSEWQPQHWRLVRLWQRDELGLRAAGAKSPEPEVCGGRVCMSDHRPRISE